MDQQAGNLLAALRRTSASAESKLTQLNTLKSDIKHYRVPDNAQATIFECLKLAISQQTSTNIVNAAFSTLGHLIKRLKIQDAQGAAIAAHAPRLWPALQERLGDAREGNRTGASQAFSDLWPFCTLEVERIMRDEAIGGNNARAKEAGMEWVVKMNQDASLPFKTFVPLIVTCLEDSDGNVRDAAKHSLVDLFRGSPDRAKADLKKQLNLHNVRSSIAEPILTQIGYAAHAPRPALEADLNASTRSLPALDHLSQFAESINSEEARPPPQEEVPMDPIFVYSNREVEDIFRDMTPHFEGKETEENWLLRDKDILKLRRLTKGNAPSEYHTVYMTGLKHLQDGTLKAANTLRTTMATNGCLLVQELARTLGPAMDSMAEIYLSSFIKMSAATKHIAAQHGATTTDTILQYVSYSRGLMQHVWAAATDKNKQPRQFAAGWLRTLLNKQAGSKSHFESSGGLELAEKTIKKGLDDADPKVKENIRATYWTFAKIWPERAEIMMQNLDPKARAALEKDSHNPNASKASANKTFAASTNSRASGARSALRERIAAARNAANKGQPPGHPPRPATSMATSTPARSPHRSQSRPNIGNRAQTLAPPSAPASRVVSNASTSSTATAKSVESSASTSSSATMRPNSLMSGAARRPVRRPELARPATADPHAARNLSRPETPSSRTNNDSPRQSTATRPTAASNARIRAERTASPATSPVRHIANTRTLVDSRASSKDSMARKRDDSNLTESEDFTMVLPTRSHDVLPVQKRPTIDKTMSVDTGISNIANDDNFTMVMPNVQDATSMNHERSPLSHGKPVRAMSEDVSGIPLPSSPRSSIHGRSSISKPRSPTTGRSPTSHRADERAGSPASEHPPNGLPRQGSPLKTFSIPHAQEEDVQIYEDPFTAEPSAKQNGDAPEIRPIRVLNELPVNESNSDPALGHSPAGSNTSTGLHDELANGAIPPQSPQTKSEILRSRKLLHSGIERIKARTLDTHGFRKVVDLARSNEPLDLFASHMTESKRYDELMSALCDYVTVPPESLSSTASHGSSNQSSELKRQALGLLKYLLTNSDNVYKKWNSAGSWPSRSLVAALAARKTIDGFGILIKDLEALCAEAVRLSQSDAVIDSIIDFQTREDEQDQHSRQNGTSDPAELPISATNKNTAHATALALRTLSAVISSPSSTTREGHNDDEDEEQQKTPAQQPLSLSLNHRTAIATLTARHLRSSDAEVRKAAVELATNLHAAWPSTEKPALNGGVADGSDDGEAMAEINGNSNGNGDVNGQTDGAAAAAGAGAGALKPGFWAALERSPDGLQEGTRNLIVYFIARREG